MSAFEAKADMVQFSPGVRFWPWLCKNARCVVIELGERADRSSDDLSLTPVIPRRCCAAERRPIRLIVGDRSDMTKLALARIGAVDDIAGITS